MSYYVDLRKKFPNAIIEEIEYDLFMVYYPTLVIAISEDYIIAYCKEDRWYTFKGSSSRKQSADRNTIEDLYSISIHHRNRTDMLQALDEILKDYNV
jgi:hypothetical protein